MKRITFTVVTNVCSWLGIRKRSFLVLMSRNQKICEAISGKMSLPSLGWITPLKKVGGRIFGGKSSHTSHKNEVKNVGEYHLPALKGKKATKRGHLAGYNAKGLSKSFDTSGLKGFTMLVWSETFHSYFTGHKALRLKQESNVFTYKYGFIPDFCFVKTLLSLDQFQQWPETVHNMSYF